MTSFRFLDGVMVGVGATVTLVAVVIVTYVLGHDAGRHSMPLACEAMPVDTITHGGRNGR